MSITKWSELDTAIDNWLDRTDLTTLIPDFVRLFEARADREIRHTQMMRRARETADAQYLTLPADWLEPIALRLITTPVQPLQAMPPEAMLNLRTDHSTTGKPKYYSIVGTTLEFLPTPDSSYTVEMLYWERISKLDSTDTESTNWLLTNYPDVYLFGSLVEAYPYLHDEQRYPLWKARLDEALLGMRKESDRSQAGGIAKARFRAVGAS